MSDKQQSAFPHPKDGGVWGNDPVPGLSIRDYFAAKAMQGLLADPSTHRTAEQIAVASFNVAKHMMAEREKK